MLQFPPLTPVARAVMIAAGLAFVAIALAEGLGHLPITEWLALGGGEWSIAVPWKVVTYALVMPPVEESILWLVVSVVFAWLILSPFELRHGPRATWIGVAGTTVAGGLGAWLLGLGARRLGFSGGIEYGLGAMTFGMLAAGVWASGTEIVSLFGRIPLRRIQVIALLAAFSVFQFAAFGAHNTAALGGDLSAIAAGLLFAKWLLRPVRPKKVKVRRGGPLLRAIPGGRSEDSDPEDDKPRWLN